MIRIVETPHLPPCIVRRFGRFVCYIPAMRRMYRVMLFGRCVDSRYSKRLATRTAARLTVQYDALLNGA